MDFNIFQALWILQHKEIGVLSHHHSYETYPHCALMEVEKLFKRDTRKSLFF